MSALFLDALHCINTSLPWRPPVWLMRQAGRYDPAYRSLREKYPLGELFHHPELAAEVTRQPLALGVDAAILFSDILVIAESFGLKVVFPEKGGPYIEPAVVTREDVLKLSFVGVEEPLAYVGQTIQLVKKDLKVPLIGFCGGPFTVASYLIDGAGHKGVAMKTREWLYQDPESFHLLLEKITIASIAYLSLQIRAGVDAIQIFDSWANVLAYPQLLEFSLPYLHKIIQALDFPVTLFCRGSSTWPKELAVLQPRAVSFDWQGDLVQLRRQVPPSIAVQGNFDPALLKAPCSYIRHSVRTLIKALQKEPGFIVNLGHGVLPDTPVEHVRCFIESVKENLTT